MLVVIFSNKNRMLLTLEPDCLTLSGGRGQPVRVAISADAAAPWIAAIAAARQVLVEQVPSGAALDIVLSESYYRLGLIQTAGEPLDATELDALARHHFRSALGDLCAACEFRIVPVTAPPGVTALLCCAIEREGVDGLSQAAAAAGCTIASLLPRIAQLEARLAVDLETYSGHLVVADRHAAALIALRAGAWTQVMMRRHAAAPDWLELTLTQAENLAVTGARAAWLSGHVATAEVTGWQLRRAPALAPEAGL